MQWTTVSTECDSYNFNDEIKKKKNYAKGHGENFFSKRIYAPWSLNEIKKLKYNKILSAQHNIMEILVQAAEFCYTTE